MSGYYATGELRGIGVTAGDGVKISRDARVFGGDRISVGDNVRIDAFCILTSGESGWIRLGSHIHIASGSRVFGQGSVTMDDFTSVSAGSTLYSASDDYSGEFLMGPGIPADFRRVDERPIVLDRFAAIGAHSLVLPGVRLGEGAVLGAGSLAQRDLEPWTIYAGVPCRPIKARRQDLVQKAAEFVAGWSAEVDR